MITKSIKLDIFVTPETFSSAIYSKIARINPRFRAEYIRSLCSYAIRMEDWFKLFRPASGAVSLPLPLNQKGELEPVELDGVYEDIRVSIIVDRESSPELFERLSLTPTKRATLRLLISTGYAMTAIIDNLAVRDSNDSVPPEKSDNESAQSLESLEDSVSKEPLKPSGFKSTEGLERSDSTVKHHSEETEADADREVQKKEVAEETSKATEKTDNRKKRFNNVNM
ncbi:MULTISPECIES: hypothetical protein [Halomonadaceae]|uniref:hypothetical protein n=1 Tax=Halomonadaceae TaxID=28256 RepID=UPI003CED8B0A